MLVPDSSQRQVHESVHVCPEEEVSTLDTYMTASQHKALPTSVLQLRVGPSNPQFPYLRTNSLRICWYNSDRFLSAVGRKICT